MIFRLLPCWPCLPRLLFQCGRRAGQGAQATAKGLSQRALVQRQHQCCRGNAVTRVKRIARHPAQGCPGLPARWQHAVRHGHGLLPPDRDGVMVSVLKRYRTDRCQRTGPHAGIAHHKPHSTVHHAIKRTLSIIQHHDRMTGRAITHPMGMGADRKAGQTKGDTRRQPPHHGSLPCRVAGVIPTIVWPDSRGTHRFKNVIHRMQTIL